MKHCPNQECPLRLRQGFADEYRDEADTCADCGTALVAGEPERPPSPAAAPKGPITAALLGRLAVTVAVPVAALTFARIPLAGIDLSALRQMGSSERPAIGALGLMPFLTAYPLVEFVALAVPRWRALRISGPAGRATLSKTALRVAMALAVLQAAMIARGFAHMGPYGGGTVALHPGWSFVLASTATLLGATVVLFLAARLIDRFGMGSGFAMLAYLVPSLSFLWSRAGTLATLVSQGEVPVGMVMLLVMVFAVLVWLIRWVLTRRPPGLSLRLPACGIIPAVLSSALLLLPATAAAISGGGSLSRNLAPGSTLYETLLLLLVLASTAALCLLFNRPGRVADVWSRCSPGSDRASMEAFARRALVPAMLVSGGLLLVAVLLPPHLSRWIPPEAGVHLIILTAIALDLAGEWSARRAMPSLTAVWPEHRLYAVDPALVSLFAAGIPAFAGSANLRTLLQFEGAIVPVSLMVPAERAEEAGEILRRCVAGYFPAVLPPASLP